MKRNGSALGRFAVAAAVASQLVAAGGLSAQDIKYTSTTSMELGGAVGRIASMMPGLGDPVQETTYIKGTGIRTDLEERSSVMDWSSGDMLEIDHPSRTYSQFNLLELAEAMTEAMREGVTEGVAAEPTEEEGMEDTAEPQFEVKFSVERTGRKEEVAGYDAEQVVLVLELVPIEPPEDVENEEEAGELAVVTELWLSTDFPEYELMLQMQAEAAERFRESGAARDLSESMAGLESFDPRLKDAWAENMEAMQDLEGTALRSTLHFVAVPFGVTLDAEKVLAAADEGLGSAVAGAAAEGVRNRARSALGRFGRRNEEPEEPEAAQSVFMRITTEIGDIQTTSLEDALFAAPEGYTEIETERPVGR